MTAEARGSTSFAIELEKASILAGIALAIAIPDKY
jgi:hypothetical protein